MAAVVRAEIGWLRRVVADLRTRRLTWSEEWIRRVAAQLASHDESAAPPVPVAARRRPRSPSGRTRR